MPGIRQRSRNIETRPFDPLAASVDEWAKFHAYRRVRQEEDYPGEPVIPDAEFERMRRQHDPLYESRRIFAIRGGELAGNLILEFRRDGTPGCEDYAPFVTVWGGVLRAHRRRGVAATLLGVLLSFMERQGKTTATMRVHVPEG